MKKFLLSLVVVLGLGFASCSNHSQQSETAEVESIEQVISVDSADAENVESVDTVICLDEPAVCDSIQ